MEIDWDEFDGDGDPLRIAEFVLLPLEALPEDVRVGILDDYFPDTTVTRTGTTLHCQISEHIYTKFWEHKFSGYAFAQAMIQAIRRLSHEGHPFADSDVDDSDVHIFVTWNVCLPATTPPMQVVEAIKAAFDLVWKRADAMLENSDSVLVLGKDTADAMIRLKSIADELSSLGYFPYIIKEQPDKPGEGVIQKVMRFALSSKFVVVENTDPSGHLYEVPHVAKAAECITVVLQETGKGATWMFEDGYAKHNHWHKQEYEPGHLAEAVKSGAQWAETFFAEYATHQRAVLPWMQSLS